jgi:hypothetical protein
MSLPACERRALDRIEKTLHAGDPRLRSLFMIFTRLTRHEAMPRTEQVSTRPRTSLLWTIAIPVALAAILSGLILSSLAPARNACVTQGAQPQPVIERHERLSARPGHGAGPPLCPLIRDSR